MKPGSAVALIESAYRTDGSTEAWLQGVAASATAALGANQGSMAFRYDASEGWVNPGAPALHDLSPEFALDFFNQKDSPAEVAAAMAQVFLSLRFGTLRTVLEYDGFAASRKRPRSLRR